MTSMTVSADGSADPLIGQLVADRYRVEAHLGEGGMGSVYKARHVTLDKPVALKVLHAEFSRKEDFVRRFLLEAKAASRIRNQHVIDITDFGTTDEGYVFFSMEFLAGKDLHSLLRSTLAEGNLLPWERAKGIFLQICDALSAAHEKGIIHRDLKPENIFLVDGTGKQDFVKLLDFGIAKVEQAEGGDDGERKLTKTGMLFGTPEYMAPEQARGEKPDHRVDVYAMGCLLFQFVTGAVPFQGESFMAILTQHMIEEVPPISTELLQRSGAPAGLLAVIDKALVKDRDQRYGSIAELAKAVASAGQVKTKVAVSAETAPDLLVANEPVGPLVTASEPPVVAEALVVGKSSNAKFMYGAVAALVLGVGAFAAISFSSGSGDSTQAESEVTVPDPKGQVSTTPKTAEVKNAEVENTVVKTAEDKNALTETSRTNDENKVAGSEVEDPSEDGSTNSKGNTNSKGKKNSKTATNRGPDKNGSKDKATKAGKEAVKNTKTTKNSGKTDSKKGTSKTGKVEVGKVNTKTGFPTE